MEEWREIVGFPGYSVSELGFIRNDRTDLILRQCRNERGIAIVGLFREGLQHKRSVSVLVGNAFILTARSLHFNTPINLDGDRFNNRVDNIAWRPRWFAIKYFQQFEIGQQGSNYPVEEIETGATFENTWYTTIAFGMLERDLIIGIVRCRAVFPTYRTYRLVV